MSEINVTQPPLLEGCGTVSGMGYLLGYARVSTTDQQPGLQVDALERAGCYRVFIETASGARTDRPVLEQLLDQLRPGDTVVVWKLNRLGRSLRHLVDTVAGLADRGIGFRSLQEAIDTTTPGGKLVFHVFAALAEFERDLIRERTIAGLAAARAPGPPRRPTLRDDHPQGPGGPGHVRLGAVHGGDDRQDPRGQPGLDLPAPHPRRQLNMAARGSARTILVRRAVAQGAPTPISGGPLWRLPTLCRSAVRQGTTNAGVGRFQSYVSVWSSISALGALRFTDSMPLIALALLS